MLTLRFLACIFTFGLMAFIAGARYGAHEMRHRQLRALTDELLGLNDEILGLNDKLLGLNDELLGLTEDDDR